MNLIKYHTGNGKLTIGTKNHHLSLFTRDLCRCIEIHGDRKLHFGRWT